MLKRKNPLSIHRFEFKYINKTRRIDDNALLALFTLATHLDKIIRIN